MTRSSDWASSAEVEARFGVMDARFTGLEERVGSIDLELQEAKRLAEERHNSLSNQLASLIQLAGASRTVLPPSGIPYLPADTAQSPIDEHRRDSSEIRSTNVNITASGIRDTLATRDTILKKIDLPIFEGDDAHTWLSLVDRFFTLGNYTDAECFELVSLGLAGRILSWYDWEISRAPFTDWIDFKEKFLLRFGKSKRAAPIDRLHNLQQVDSIEDYVEEFQRLAAPMKDLSEEHQIAIFKKGLKPELQTIVRLLKPKDLPAMISLVLEMAPDVVTEIIGSALAKDSHANNHQQSPYFKTRTITSGHNSTRSVQSHSVPSTDTSITKQIGSHSTKHRGRRHLSPVEYEERRKNKQCFRCDGPWMPGHRCPKADLQVLLLLHDCEILLDEKTPDEELEEDIVYRPQCCRLSLNVFLGRTTPRTTKIRGLVGSIEVIVLLDSGASHNFISPALVTKLHLKQVHTNRYEVSLGTGIVVKSDGICLGVSFKLADAQFEADFVTLELGNADIILGIQWLQTLGVCECNFAEQSLSFDHHGRRITLRGDPALHELGVPFHQNTKHSTLKLQTMQYSTLFTLSLPALSTVPNIFRDLLQKYAQVFGEPDSLPPKRELEHAINLVPGTPPVCIRPYRYPHAQKEAMAQLVQKMLSTFVYNNL